MRIALLALAFLFSTCGRQPRTVVRRPTPPPDPAFELIRADVERECNRCHGKIVGLPFRGVGFKRAGQRVQTNNMPPDRTLPEDIKRAFLQYIQNT